MPPDKRTNFVLLNQNWSFVEK